MTLADPPPPKVIIITFLKKIFLSLPLDTLDTSPNSGHNHKNITYIFVGVRLLVANFIQQNFYITLFS